MASLGLRIRVLQNVKSASFLNTRKLTGAARRFQAIPNEDDPYQIGTPTPEQFAEMQAHLSGKPVARPKDSHPLDVHTVEDLHHLTAQEALRETGTRRDATMRHFTGAYSVSETHITI